MKTTKTLILLFVLAIIGIASASMFNIYGKMEGIITVGSCIQVGEYYECFTPNSGEFWYCSFNIENNCGSPLNITLQTTVSPGNHTNLVHRVTEPSTLLPIYWCGPDCNCPPLDYLEIQPGTNRITTFLYYEPGANVEGYDITTNVKIIP